MKHQDKGGWNEMRLEIWVDTGLTRKLFSKYFTIGNISSISFSKQNKMHKTKPTFIMYNAYDMFYSVL